MRLLPAVAALLLPFAGAASAAIVLHSTSELTTGVVGPPVRFELGAAGQVARYVSSFAASANGTSVSGTLLPRAGADWTAVDLVRLVNDRASSQSVTLTATQVSNAQVDVFTWRVYDGSTLVGTLDMESASPSLSFSIPASTTYKLTLRLDLADGAGADNAPSSFALSVGIGSGVLSYPSSAPALGVSTVVVPFGKLAAGSSVGANATNATASIAARVVVQGTDNAFYLNNTDASAAWYAKLVYVGSATIANLQTFDLGINNGTSVDHIETASGSVTKSSGSYQRLEPSSTNRIYVTSLEGVLFSTGYVDFDVLVSDTATGESFLLTKARVTLT